MDSCKLKTGSRKRGDSLVLSVSAVWNSHYTTRICRSHSYIIIPIPIPSSYYIPIKIPIPIHITSSTMDNVFDITKQNSKYQFLHVSQLTLPLLSSSDQWDKQLCNILVVNSVNCPQRLWWCHLNLDICNLYYIWRLPSACKIRDWSRYCCQRAGDIWWRGMANNDGRRTMFTLFTIPTIPVSVQRQMISLRL